MSFQQSSKHVLIIDVIIQLTEFGAHGVLGANVVKHMHVSTVQEKENVCAINQNQPLMEHSALVLDIRRKTAVVFTLV